MTELEFLKSKGLIKEGFAEFVISGDFGKVELTELLKEYKTEQLRLHGVVSSYLIKFNEVDTEGNMYLPNSINIESLNNLKVSGQIKDFEIDENGVKVIKDFRLEGGSL